MQNRYSTLLCCVFHDTLGRNVIYYAKLLLITGGWVRDPLSYVTLITPSRSNNQ